MSETKPEASGDCEQMTKPETLATLTLRAERQLAELRESMAELMPAEIIHRMNQAEEREAKLREPMKCGHPGACLNRYMPPSSRSDVYCTACEREAKLREALAGCMVDYLDSIEERHAAELVAMIKKAADSARRRAEGDWTQGSGMWIELQNITGEIEQFTPDSARAALDAMLEKAKAEARLEEAKWWAQIDWASLDSHQHVCIEASEPQNVCIICERIAELERVPKP